MTKRYNNPPIIEALCEFQFDTDVSWDLTLIGLIYDKLKEFFPKKQQLPLNLAIAATSETNEQAGNIPLLPLVRFLDSDEKKLVQLGQNLLTVNHLKPYDSWEEFSPVIENVFKIYLETAKPKGLRHIAIRYINRIEVPRANISWESLFRLRVLIPQDLPENIEAFLIGVNLPYEDAKDTLRIQLGTVNTEATDIIAMLLEITYIFTQPGEIPLPDVLQRVNVAHKHVENAFESCLTDELKQTFEEVKG
jgi:uncharacterized protein (TIGR04255 family)